MRWHQSIKATHDAKRLRAEGVKARMFTLFPGYAMEGDPRAKFDNRRGAGKGWKAQSKRNQQYRT